MCHLLNSLDIYGEPVRLHYEGKPTYTTKTGAMLSILTYIWLIFIAGIGVKRINHDWNPVFSEYSKGSNMTETVLNPFQKGKDFDIAFGFHWERGHKNQELDFYGYFDVEYMEQRRNEEGELIEKISKKVPFHPCNMSMDFLHYDEVKKHKVSPHMNCI